MFARSLWIAAVGLALACGGATANSDTPTAPKPAKPKPATTAPAVPPSPCTTADYRQFDFWLGEWSVRTGKGKLAGSNRIIKAHRGCALTEHWRSARGGTGTSINHWNPVTKQWVQHWVDGTGGIIHLVGGLNGKAMKLDGSYIQANGTKSRLRGTWTPMADGRVRQLFEQSTDGGKTWTVWFDGYYSKK